MAESDDRSCLRYEKSSAPARFDDEDSAVPEQLDCFADGGPGESGLFTDGLEGAEEVAGAQFALVDGFADRFGKVFPTREWAGTTGCCREESPGEVLDIVSDLCNISI